MKVMIDEVLYVPEPPRVTGATLEAALGHRFDSDAGDNLTVREYLHALLKTLWTETESFNGKRPFGNSGWPHDLFNALAQGGFIDMGEADEDGYFDSTREQDEAADKYVHSLIDAAFFGVRQL